MNIPSFANTRDITAKIQGRFDPGISDKGLTLASRLALIPGPEIDRGLGMAITGGLMIAFLSFKFVIENAYLIGSLPDKKGEDA